MEDCAAGPWVRYKKRAEGAGDARPRARDNEETDIFRVKNGAKMHRFFRELRQTLPEKMGGLHEKGGGSADHC